MNRPQLTVLHYSICLPITDPPSTFQKIKDWWESISNFKRTSLMLNVSAVFLICCFGVYLYSKKVSENKKKNYLTYKQNGERSFRFE